MTVLLEFREKLRGFYGKYEAFLLPAIKFLLALSVFLLIRQKIGYMERLNSLSLLLIAALACSILPVGAMLLATEILITLHCYALTMPAGVMVFVLFAIMYLLYFRLAPLYVYNALLAPIACMLGIPYAVPAANGLLQNPMAVIPTICGMVTYYFLNGITANEASLATAVTKEELPGKFREIISQFTGNREMYLMAAAFVLAAFVVYAIRRLSVDYAWTIAIVVGMLAQYLVFLFGYMQIGMSSMATKLTVGCVASVLLLLVLQFFCFNLDYTRTERVQFEDDEYYYYVKAVPKRYVSTREKTVKKISGNGKKRKSKGEEVTREELIEDLDIDYEDE